MDVSTTGSASIVDVIDRARDYFGDYEPDMKAVTYDYRDRTSEMTIKITVPKGLSRRRGTVRIPVKEGYRIKEMYTSAFQEVNSVWTREEDEWVLNPENLPSEKDYLIRLEGQVDAEKFDKIVDLNVPEDPVTEGGVDKYWIQSALRDPSALSEIYQELRVDNIDMNIEVGVQRCFSTAIPKRIRKSFERTDELIEASNEGDRNKIITSSRRRQEARKEMSMSEGELAKYLRSLATSERLGEYISIESPFKRRQIETSSMNHMVFPEQVNVDVTTSLNLETQAAEGELSFEKNDYTDFLEKECEDLL
ncbi:hypothetical protein GOC83_03985 [Haloarcula rubripromontorii]|uniref:Uncharacterized protein n=1 Tax=Haloarcula rubripromontorii TaxID=1705562 RepID=A0A847THH3_9EURY|nr:hypothetical protein [Haloarcula rubripromontorii]NLV05292.1 hypothetical protein [Haloarcula rubripromontorii]